MQSAFALVVVAWLLYLHPVWASLGSDFVRRQCDSLACDPSGENWFTGFFGGLIDWIDNGLDWGSTTTDDGKTNLPPAPAQPEDENFVQGEKVTGSKKCEANAPPAPGPQDTISVGQITKYCPSSFEF